MEIGGETVVEDVTGVGAAGSGVVGVAVGEPAAGATGGVVPDGDGLAVGGLGGEAPSELLPLGGVSPTLTAEDVTLLPK